MGYENETVEQDSRIRIRQKASRARKKALEDTEWERKVSTVQKARYGEQEEEYWEEDPILADEWLARLAAKAKYERGD